MLSTKSLSKIRPNRDSKKHWDTQALRSRSHHWPTCWLFWVVQFQLSLQFKVFASTQLSPLRCCTPQCSLFSYHLSIGTLKESIPTEKNAVDFVFVQRTLFSAAKANFSQSLKKIFQALALRNRRFSSQRTQKVNKSEILKSHNIVLTGNQVKIAKLINRKISQLLKKW